MRSHTKPLSSGNVELLLVMPLMAMLAWGSLLVTQSLIQQGRLERASWVSVQSHNLGTEMNAIQTEVLPTLGSAENPPTYHFDAGENCADIALGVLSGDEDLDLSGHKGSCVQETAEIMWNMNEDLPFSFRGWLALKWKDRRTLKQIQDVPPVPGFDRDYTQAGFPMLEGISPILEQPVEFRASDFQGSRALKQLLFQEEMRDAGFPVWLPLQLVGGQEVWTAIQGLSGVLVSVGSIPGLDDLLSGFSERFTDSLTERLEENLLEGLQEQVEERIQGEVQGYFREGLLNELKDHAGNFTIF